jgi:hypothetical protein
MGKTTFAAQLPNSLIIDLEHGTDLIDAVKITAESLVELAKYGRLIKEQGKPYTYIIIDTITKLEELCEWEATEDYMNSLMGKKFNRDDNGNLIPRPIWESVLSLPNGAGYLWLRTSFKRWIESLSTLAPHIILVAHLKDKMIEKAGKEVSAKDLDLTGKIRSITAADADAIGYLYRKEDKDGKSVLRINFSSSETVLCGSRVAHLAGKDIIADWDEIFIDK